MSAQRVAHMFVVYKRGPGPGSKGHVLYDDGDDDDYYFISFTLEGIALHWTKCGWVRCEYGETALERSRLHLVTVVTRETVIHGEMGLRLDGHLPDSDVYKKFQKVPLILKEIQGSI